MPSMRRMRQAAAGFVALSRCACGLVTSTSGRDNIVTADNFADEVMVVPTLFADSSACLAGWNAINPSLLDVGGNDRLVVLRGLCMHKEGGHRHIAWESQLVIGSTSVRNLKAGGRKWDHIDIVPDPRFVQVKDFTECQLSSFDVSSGPEDPRLVMAADGSAYVVFAGYDAVPSEGSGRPECQGRGFLLHAAPITSSSPPQTGPSVPLTFKDMHLVEKNWAMFTADGNSGSEVNAVYQIYPHTIAKVQLSSGNVSFEHETYSNAVKALASTFGISPTDFHGGAGVAYVKTAHSEYFLSVLHCGRVAADHKYRNWPYKFSTKPPFEIIAVGQMLPLEAGTQPAYGSEVAFVSSVVVDEGDVMIGYGSGDTSSHLYKMPLDAFEQAHFARDLWQTRPNFNAYLGGDAKACEDETYKEQCSDTFALSICRRCPDGP